MIGLIFALFLFAQGATTKKEIVTFGATEFFPNAMFKGKDKGKGLNQEHIKFLLEGSNFEARWVEMSNLRQRKELSKKDMFCRTEIYTIDWFNVQRKKTSIEEYIDKDLKKVKFKILESIPTCAIQLIGYVAIKENKINNFKKYFKGTYNGLPGLDGLLLVDQHDLKTGFNAGATFLPPILVNAGINKKIKMLETIMDFEYNFFRMVESGRMDFYIDLYSIFIPKNKKIYDTIPMIKEHPELQNLVSLRVPAFDFYALEVYQCSQSAVAVIDIINKKTIELFKTKQTYTDFQVQIGISSLGHVGSMELVEKSVAPGYDYWRALQDGKDQEFIEKKY